MTFRSGKAKSGKPRSRSARAGLAFPVGRISRQMRKSMPHVRLGSGAPVYLAAVLEYLTVEVLDLAGMNSKSERKRRIKPKNIRNGVTNDPELNKLCADVTFSEGGQNIHIEKELIPIGKNKKTGVGKPSKLKSTVKPHKIPVRKSSARPGAGRPGAPRTGTAGTGTGSTSGSSNGSNSLPSLSEATLFLGQKLHVIKGDMMDVDVEALVHPTDSSYSTSGQVGSALARVGGLPFTQALQTLHSENGNIPACGATASEMFNTKAKRVIHCNSPSWHSKSGVNDLEKTILNCFKAADRENVKSIALPSVGSGNAGWPKQLAAETILRAINSYFQSVMASSIKEVYFVLYDSESVTVYTTELSRLIHSITA